MKELLEDFQRQLQNRPSRGGLSLDDPQTMATMYDQFNKFQKSKTTVKATKSLKPEDMKELFKQFVLENLGDEDLGKSKDYRYQSSYKEPRRGDTRGDSYWDTRRDPRDRDREWYRDPRDYPGSEPRRHRDTYIGPRQGSVNRGSHRYPGDYRSHRYSESYEDTREGGWDHSRDPRGDWKHSRDPYRDSDRERYRRQDEESRYRHRPSPRETKSSRTRDYEGGMYAVFSDSFTCIYNIDS